MIQEAKDQVTHSGNLPVEIGVGGNLGPERFIRKSQLRGLQEHDVVRKRVRRVTKVQDGGERWAELIEIVGLTQLCKTSELCVSPWPRNGKTCTWPSSVKAIAIHPRPSGCCMYRMSDISTVLC
jgi:hypothetical protein